MSGVRPPRTLLRPLRRIWHFFLLFGPGCSFYEMSSKLEGTATFYLPPPGLVPPGADLLLGTRILSYRENVNMRTVAQLSVFAAIFGCATSMRAQLKGVPLSPSGSAFFVFRCGTP